jgi:hypothetical protein
MQFKVSADSGDKGAMLKILLSVLAFGLLSTSGCMVLDEVDAASAKMKKLGKNQEKVEEGSSPGLAAQAMKTKTELLEQSREWWDEATSLSPTAVDAEIVNCDIHGGSQFMSKDDCLIRGGLPKSAAG